MNIVFSLVPGLIDMGVHNNVGDIVVLEQGVPGWREVEGVVENKDGVWVRAVDDLLSRSIEVHQGVSWGVPPWLVNWLKSVHGWVGSPPVHQLLDVVEGPVDMVLVDVVIRPGRLVPVTDPVGREVFPVLEIVLVNPGEWLGLTRVVKTILGSLKAMDIEQNLDSVLFASIQEPLDLVFRTVHAAFVNIVWLQGPVTDWKSDNFDLSVGHVLDFGLGNPVFPMVSHKSISFFSSQGLAHGVGVNSNSIRLSVSEESIEERWGDPWLKDQPSSSVGSNHSLASSEGSKRCGSEGF